ncbi:hypothetical protein StrepF001_19440 [Streptomyces sp. F001]|uniref:hypothetical protein n=1 Tax=Streptomyces sp. F001 TaxID=1510026 RepID=UPI00101E3FEF|nr:hypothetical protein [Streptomyces sp. F001]RZB17953.1 hypothetical protein StrepF001_19440 [Streptomyces sp. F001]
MPRGRHRHSPPLHRLLPPSAIAGVSLVCALGPWVFTEPTVLRGLAAAAAVTAVAGAVVLRRWDTQAGKQVADLTRARASDEWRHEERVAELETDLEESRELRVKLEQRLRAKRAELAGLRNEHAALLRRYATAETERASALEGRRLLEIEAATPARALPPAPTTEETEAVAAPADPDEVTDTDEATDTDATDETVEQKAAASGLFSPEGSRLFLRARAALVRFDADTEASAKEHADQEASPKEPAADAERVTGAEAAQEDEARGKSEAADGHERAAATTTADTAPSDDNAAAAPAESVPATARPAAPVQQPSGHFTVPTAVAVVPASVPVRRPTAEGGFDFFGTKANTSAALEAVQNEDLADVVGQEALDLHKAEAEAEFKPAGEESRGIGQVIDLTAHDETEQIDMQGLRGLRSAVS